MASMVTGTLTGEAAVEAYQDGGMVYCCDFLQDVDRFIFEGTTISGDDADSGEFTYFCIAPDTMDTTWHTEFRYGSDLDALGKYGAGEYAYWLASGISVDYAVCG